MSDFYAEWIALKLSLGKKVGCDFASKLIQCMDDREKNLFQNQTLLAALFLDARYRVFLKDKPLDKHAAITHLTLVWKRLQELKPPALVDEAGKLNATSSTNQNQDKYDELDTLLTSLDTTSSDSHIQTATCDQIVAMLQKFDNEMNSVQREQRTKHPMDFWEENKYKYAEIYKLAQIIFAAAPTEVSVERCFSGLAFILNKYRYSLSDENIDTILFIRLNKKVFDFVVGQ